MNDFETRLANRMHSVADGVTGAPPTENLLTRGRVGRRKRRSMVGGAVVAAAVAIGVVTAAVQPSAPGHTPDGTPVAAAVRLAAAVEASDNISYRVKVTTSSTETTEGAFDPATRTGYLSEVVPAGGNAYLERLVDGVRYVGCANCDDRWKQYPGTHDRLAYDSALNSAASASADPEALFDMLTQAGAKITQTGAGFHFEVAVKGDDPVTLVGEVTLGQDNRIASVTYEETTSIEKTRGPAPTATTTTGAEPTTDAPGETEIVTSTRQVTVELSDYGTPVTVERPTDVVVVEEN